jgi:two-component system CheB/CheR fusion protein
MSPQSPTVVGIGASAGGLAALKQFFKEVPVDSGLAFVVVVHLAPEHKSHLADLLQVHAGFPVQQVTETTLLEPNHVYVIPPNANIEAIDTHLRLSELEKQRAQRAPIDHFFRTLATTHDGHSVGIILSGTGSDGTLGIRDIKAKGGLIIVQNPNDAEYDGMPQSAIATGLADFVLPVTEIPQSLLRYDRTQPRVTLHEEDVAEVAHDEQNLLQKVFTHLRARTDRDFSRYRRSTLMRRIARRMQLNYIEDLSGYVEKLRENPDEVRALSDDLLVTVTSFFRDPEVFEKLRTDLIPHLFQDKEATDSVRVWSVGCATGEEAYSIAMLLLEEAAPREGWPQIQIFASDLHKRSLDRAREGFYPGDIELDVSSDRLKRFFTRESGGYRIRKEVRDLVVFAPHNLLGDPPFSRLDFIACRNLLIYLERDVQRAVIELFHYALNRDGTLLLGSAETVEDSDLFRPDDKRLCLYRKRNVPAPEPRLPVFPLTRGRALFQTDVKSTPVGEPIAYGNFHQRMVEQYAPPSILISPDNKIVHLSEHAGRYLVHPGGEPTANIFKLVREELRIELRTLLQCARERQQVCDSKPLPVLIEGDIRAVAMHVGPGHDSEQDGFALIIFEEREAKKPDEPHAEGPTNVDHSGRIQDLETELTVLRQRLQSIIEEFETSQEEMRASNEEIQSTNEELRSTMEELETSKEELQSINEELLTVNQENRHKVEELAQLSSDLQNLLSATDIATLFLDTHLRIMRFTPKVSELFHVRVTDRGRPISDLTHRLGHNDLKQDAERVLAELMPVEREIQDDSGNWYLTRVLPYRSTENRIEGVVITFVEITRRLKAETGLRESQKQLTEELSVARRLHELVGRLFLSPNLSVALQDILASAVELTGADFGNVQLFNPRTNALEIVARHGFDGEFAEHFRSIALDERSACGRALKSAARAMVDDVERDPFYKPYRVAAAQAGYRAVQSTPLISRDGRILGILSTHYAHPHAASERDLRMLDLYTRQAADFVEHRRAEEELRQSEERYRLLVENAREYAIIMLEQNGHISTWNSGAERIFGYSEKEVLGRHFAVLFTAEDRAAAVPEEELKTAAQQGQAADDRWQARKDGSRFWANGALELLRSQDGAASGFVKVLRDNTDRKKAEDESRAYQRELRTVNEVLSRANADLTQFAIAASHDLRAPLRTVSACSQVLIQATRAGRREEADRAAQLIVEANDRMGQLLEDLLAYTQLSPDVGSADQVVDLNVVMAETIGNLETTIEGCGALVTHDVLPKVRGRDAYFVQLFQNLIDNSIKYRGDAPPRIHISVEKQAQEWRFAIKDNGIGVDAPYHEQIFEVFNRLHGNQIPGSGFGLAICRRVVERCGGRIWVGSESGPGSTFYFTLPVLEEEVAPQDATLSLAGHNT